MSLKKFWLQWSNPSLLPQTAIEPAASDNTRVLPLHVEDVEWSPEARHQAEDVYQNSYRYLPETTVTARNLKRDRERAEVLDSASGTVGLALPWLRRLPGYGKIAFGIGVAAENGLGLAANYYRNHGAIDKGEAATDIALNAAALLPGWRYTRRWMDKGIFKKRVQHSKTYNIPNPAKLVDQVDDASKIADYGLDPETIRVEDRRKRPENK